MAELIAHVVRVVVSTVCHSAAAAEDRGQHRHLVNSPHLQHQVHYPRMCVVRLIKRAICVGWVLAGFLALGLTSDTVHCLEVVLKRSRPQG